jgi:type II secretory pathway component PulL
MASNNEDSLAEKEQIEKNFNIRINMPSPERYIKADAYPPWFWAAVGSALLSLNPRDEINLLSNKRSEISVPMRLVFLYTGCLAGLCVIALLLSSLNVHEKNKVLTYLNGEQGKIFRTAFPKSPPMKDVNKFFEDRIKTIDREVAAGGLTNVGMAPLQVLAEISLKVDNQLDVKINEFTADEREFAISGSTVSFAAVEKLKSAIEQIRDVRDVEIQNVDIAAAKQVRFRVRGRL